MNCIRIKCAQKIVLISCLLFLLFINSACALNDDTELNQTPSNASGAVPKQINGSCCLPRISNPFKHFFFRRNTRRIGVDISVVPDPNGVEINKLSRLNNADLSNSKALIDDRKRPSHEVSEDCVKDDNYGACANEKEQSNIFKNQVFTFENSEDESSFIIDDLSFQRLTLRILFVEDEPALSEAILKVLDDYNEDLFNKYFIHYVFLTHGFIAIDYLLSPKNIKPHIIVSDNNMECLQQIREGLRISLKAGCELGKFLRPNKNLTDSVYHYQCEQSNSTENSYVTKKKGVDRTYKRMDYVRTYSEKQLHHSMQPFVGLLFLSTSDSATELGPENVALFDGLPPKLRYLPTFKKFLKDNEAKIDEMIYRY